MPSPRRRARVAPTEAEHAPVRSPGELGFAQIVGAAYLPSAPKRVRKRPTAAPPETGEEPLADALERALLMVRGGQVEAGLALSQKLWPRAAQADDALQMGICQHVMAIGYHYSGKLKEALTTGHVGIELFARAGDTTRRLRLMSLHAITLAQLGQAAEAMELLGRAVELLPQIDGEPWQQCVFWNNAGSVYETLNQTPEALAAWERCIALSAHFDEPSMKAISRGNLLTIRLTSLHREKADRETVLAAYAEQRRHLDALVQEERHHLVMNWAAEAADVMIQLGEMEEARALLHMGLKCGAAAGLGPKRASLELQFAHVERLSGQLRPAAAHVAEALALANESQDLELLARVHLENSLLQEAQSHWRAALDCYKRYAQTREALLAAQAEARSQALAARVDVERNRVDAELARLRSAELQRQVEHLARQAGELKRQALEDPLTGLANRRQFERRIDQLRGEGPPGQPLVLMIGDIDHFKRINDRYSHTQGDEVLRTIGRLMRDHLRPHDVVARWGGEEFVVGFGAGLTLAQALTVADRLRGAIERHAWASMAPALSVTMSLGLAECRVGDTIADTLQRADEALYECKRGGRNQVRAAP
ncbi:MAG TPA: GGDEF domain-containing protein [Ideonella sp.]|uniref:tetratricopeptide repeat-containing diguanylate cyclase n=1 Tax=Ideonella sp. TaxID=1929293 RepID=UPI002E30AE34|nr:GGDEF domain-containing protein [Ideonella sp.]HEX5683244.1 GGDEF domain-containing protein [Ideonella sp.]